MATQGISFKQFSNIAPHILRTRKPIMGHGPHGIGKSAIVYQLADKLASILGLEDPSYVYPVIERRASQMADTGDVIGVPEPEDSDYGRITKFAPMGWFARACSEPCIMFFDEVDRANNDVRQSLMELTDSRKIAGHTLHPDTVIVAMVNGGSHDENNAYQVSELDPAEHDRWWHVNLEPTVQDWLDWGQGRLTDMVWNFINDNKKHLEHKGEIEPNKVYPSRRSWHHFDKCIQDSDMSLLQVEEVSGKLPMDIYFIGEGFIGQEASIAFKDYVEKFEKNVSVQDILEGKKTELVKKFQVNDSNAMIDKIAASDEMKDGLSDEQVVNLAKFIYSIQAELAMKAWEKFTNVNHEVVKQLWATPVTDKLNFGGYIAQIVGDDTDDS